MRVTIRELASFFEARFIEYRPVSEPFEALIQTDSRLVKPGNLFIAIPGEHLDGYRFIPEAIRQGAIGVIAEQPYPDCHADFELIVPSTSRALLTAAKKALRTTSCQQIGITGSAGKTTIKEMLSFLLSTSFKVAKTSGNYNTPVGVPLSILAMDSDADFFITELSASYPGEIDQNLAYLALSDAVISSIGPSHLAFFQTVENIVREKMKIGANLPADGSLLLPGDNPLIRTYPFQKQQVHFGLLPENDIQAVDLIYQSDRVHYQVKLPGETIRDLSLTAYGEHMVANSLPVIFLARKYSVPISLIKDALAAFSAPVGRGRCFHTKGGYSVVDETYNANPVSFKAALEAFSKTIFARKLLVFSDMLELGEESSSLHRSLAKDIANYSFQTVLYYGDYNEQIEPILLQAGFDYRYLPNLEELEKAFLQSVLPGDGVLMKASNGKHLSILIQHLENQ